MILIVPRTEIMTFVSYLSVNTTSWGITFSGIWPCVTGCWVPAVTGQIPCLETAGTIYTVMERHILEDVMSPLHLCGSPKIRTLRLHDENKSGVAVGENDHCLCHES